MVTVTLTSFPIVREKERGTLEQLLVTLLQPLGLMMGKLMPYFALGLFETAVILTFMRSAFQVPIHWQHPAGGVAFDVLSVRQSGHGNADIHQGQLAIGSYATGDNDPSAEYFLVGLYVFRWTTCLRFFRS